MPQDRRIYVEIRVCAGLDEVWRYTQVPELHELWDLRFTAIDYLPRRPEQYWSTDPKSLNEEGSAYWQYVPANGGVRFLTWYDYRTRFGAAGRLIDRLLFRPRSAGRPHEVSIGPVYGLIVACVLNSACEWTLIHALTNG